MKIILECETLDELLIAQYRMNAVWFKNEELFVAPNLKLMDECYSKTTTCLNDNQIYNPWIHKYIFWMEVYV